eukprot:TRINITY_DN67480_c4_g1_i2.p1 TRINITY_DN67480_c4_g1~~TRINITY_DN67480_c4_g1_i2.p1  ORF type:complete len:274 (+),score=10.47 TRINITY_DN67480_c4_g1_i2:109-822(+)
MMVQLKGDPHVVSVYGVLPAPAVAIPRRKRAALKDPVTGEESVCYMIVMEFLAGGSIKQTLDDLKIGRLTISAISKYTHDILLGVQSLHSINLIHCDIKPGNILIDEYGNCKLGNLGAARNADTLTSSGNAFAGTLRYCPPEVLAAGAGISKAGDIWMVGLTVLEMHTRRRPWGGYPNAAGILLALEGMQDLPPGVNEIVDSSLRDFLSKCLAKNPRQRWTTTQLLSHPFVKQHEKK